MIYDVNSPQYQQFLAKSRKREGPSKAAGGRKQEGKQQTHKAGGAASTGL